MNKKRDNSNIYWNIVIAFVVLFVVYIIFFWRTPDRVTVEALVNESDYTVYSGRNVYEWWKSTLTENQQIFYDEMKESYLQFRKDFSTQVKELTIDEAEETYSALRLDHPEIFWMNNYIPVPNIDLKTLCTEKIQLKYFYSEEEAKEIKSRIEPFYLEIINEAKKKKNTLKKVQYVHDKLIELTTLETEALYDNNRRIDQSIVTIFDEQKSVCAGYAYGFKFIMDKLDIDTVVVKELIIEGAEYNHVWNMVNVYGKWYNVDVTYDKANSSDGNISNKYFLTNNKDFYTNHSIQENIPQN